MADKILRAWLPLHSHRLNYADALSRARRERVRALGVQVDRSTHPVVVDGLQGVRHIQPIVGIVYSLQRLDGDLEE